MTVCGDERTERSYTLTLLDDPPERHEAVSFLTAKVANQKSKYRRLLPKVDLPPEVKGMCLDEAQAYLDAHPVRQCWESLTISHEDLIFDDDLARLQHIPEIERVTIRSSRITNRGIRHLRHLTNPKLLVLCSRRVTSTCLVDIACLTSLETLDLTMSPFVSRAAFFTATKQLPLLQDCYPPWRWPLTALFRWFYVEWRIQRAQQHISQSS